MLISTSHHHFWDRILVLPCNFFPGFIFFALHSKGPTLRNTCMCYFITLFCAWKAPNSHYFSSLFLFKILATVKTNNFPYFLKRSAKNEMKVDLVRETFLEDELGNPLRDLRGWTKKRAQPLGKNLLAFFIIYASFTQIWKRGNFVERSNKDLLEIGVVKTKI